MVNLRVPGPSPGFRSPSPIIRVAVPSDTVVQDLFGWLSGPFRGYSSSDSTRVMPSKPFAYIEKYIKRSAKWRTADRSDQNGYRLHR